MPKKSSSAAPCPDIPTADAFWKWATKIPVSSRDSGFGPITPWGTQRHLVQEIFSGLADGYHQFLIHKGGQIGATMVGQLIATYWLTEFAGVQGAIVTNSEDVTQFCRDNVSAMVKASPKTCDVRVDNKNMLALDNGSRLLFHTAGQRSATRLSVGRGFNFAWGTEMALWPNAAALTIMRTRASETHPLRLYVYESTPRGRNHWFDVWEEAADAVDIKRIILFWWQREDYRVARDSDIFKRYWNGQLRSKERRWQRELERRYDTTLTPEQLAWRRWYVAEKAGGDDRLADQEEATLPEDGFEATGISFLTHDALRRCRRTVSAAPTPDRYRYEFGANIEDTRLKKTIPDFEQLCVWEEPQPVQGYVVAGVPAFSTNMECADFACSVWKATRDELVQVAEFGDEDIGMQEFAWLCAHLVGTYAAHRRAFILEISGMGAGVLQELKRLHNYGWGTAQKPRLSEVVGGIRHYLWRRPDSLSAAAALQWKSSPDLQIILMNRLRDQVGSGRVTIRSHAMLSELERIRQEGDLFKAEGRVASNHRVIAGALAVESWASQLVPLFKRVQGQTQADTVQGRMIGEFFGRLRGLGARTTRA